VSSPERVIEESNQSMSDLIALVGELNKHTQRLRTEIATLSFMTLVQAADVNPDELYASIGGEDGIRTAVAMLYERVMSDPELAPYFSGTDMIRLRRRQVDMFLALFGVQPYSGRNLHTAHAGLHVTRAHFNRLLDHVALVLSHLGVSPSDVAAFVDRLRPFEIEIVE